MLETLKNEQEKMDKIKIKNPMLAMFENMINMVFNEEVFNKGFSVFYML